MGQPLRCRSFSGRLTREHIHKLPHEIHDQKNHEKRPFVIKHKYSYPKAMAHMAFGFL